MHAAEPTAGTVPGRPGVAYRVREARAADIRSLVRLYRSQTPEMRRFHHPYPFDRPRALAVFSWMVLSRPIRRWLIRRGRGWGFLVVVAEEPKGRTLVGYGTARFRYDARGPLAWFGYLVAPGHQGRGVGSAIALELYRASVDLGVVRGGGQLASDNAASRHILEGLGFVLTPARRGESGVAELEGVADLREVLRRAAAVHPGSEGPDP